MGASASLMNVEDSELREAIHEEYTNLRSSSGITEEEIQ